MKRLLSIGCFLLLFNNLQAQLGNGELAPDFSFKDVNGNMQQLYSYLNAGKYVVLDISTTWCSPCWSYHGTHILNDFYHLHDLPGDQKAKVFFIEADSTTNDAALYGLSGSTMGDWVTGTPYSIMNPGPSPLIGETSIDSFLHQYHLFGLPSIFVICPDRKAWHYTMGDLKATLPDVANLEWIFNNKCNAYPTSTLNFGNLNEISLYPNPVNDFFYVQGSIIENERPFIFDLTGRQLGPINYEMIEPSKIRIETAKLQEGIYLLKMGNQMIRFTKQ